MNERIYLLDSSLIQERWTSLEDMSSRSAIALSSKRSGARKLGIATFEHYVAKEYCTGEPLIEKRLADQVLLQVQSN